MQDLKFDWNNISIIPATISDIESRKEITVRRNGKLPLFVAPMDMVIDEENVDLFLDEGYNVCMPRGIESYGKGDQDVFFSFGLDEIIEKLDKKSFLPNKVLIDVANGHMKKLYDTAKRIKEERSEIELMIGNIANPDTYRRYCEIGVDWIRVGIGGGSACTTSANAAIHFPMASLIQECYKISTRYDNPTKIVADGGFQKFADIIKALALGAHSVMLGGVLSKCIEACSESYIVGEDGYQMVEEVYDLNKDLLPQLHRSAKNYFNKGVPVYKYYRGMSTKEVQSDWGKTDLKTAEGITKYNRVEYTLSGWSENFVDYLKSNMSYCNKRNLDEYSGKVDIIHITDHAYNRFNK